ncbi:unnamed protein product [Orchesella dallaii]|uniref:Tektin n=1 Tax=Orchesella dallaii TaxID=48710 RepID=A0ABP1Q3V2_9HEXA
MYRYTRYTDHYPSPMGYQYRYFYPLPVLPSTQGSEAPRTHTCNVHSYEHGCNLWNRMGTRYSDPDMERTLVRDHALKKVLPWRANPTRDVSEDSSFYTGKGITYKGTSQSDLFHDIADKQKFPDLVTASNVCASHAARTYAYPGPKYSVDEWKVNNKQLCTGAECVHNTVTMVQTEAVGAIHDTNKQQVRHHSDTNADIDGRVHDISTWLENERDELKYNVNQTHELLELKERLEQMLKGIQTPLEITQENLLTRETRQGVELVHDAVEECLHKELESLKKNQDKLLMEMERVNSQLSRLRAARHELETDMRNKDEARKTDECVKILARLQDEIGGLEISDGTNANSSPSSWLQLTQSLIRKSQEERNSAQMLYTEVSRSMLSSADECFSIWYETNASFSTRVSELMSAKQQIEKQLHRIKHDIDSLNRHMSSVRKALDEKLPMLRLAQARLEKRKERPGIELCRDKVMLALLKEIHALKISSDQLQTKLKDMEQTMSQLMKTKASLEHDIKMKEVALFLDREKCLTLRQNFPMSTFKETRFPKTLGSNGMPDSKIMR